MATKLDVKAFGLACGILWGAVMVFIAFAAMFFDIALDVVAFFGRFYLGYAATFVGSLVGFVWGFADAGIGGALLAWLYNKLAK